MLTVQIQIRNVYGENKAYPMNDTAKYFARIANTKTLTRSTLVSVLAMGCMIAELDRHLQPSRTYRSVGDVSNLPMVA